MDLADFKVPFVLLQNYIRSLDHVIIIIKLKRNILFRLQNSDKSVNRPFKNHQRFVNFHASPVGIQRAPFSSIINI